MSNVERLLRVESDRLKTQLCTVSRHPLRNGRPTRTDGGDACESMAAFEMQFGGAFKIRHSYNPG